MPEPYLATVILNGIQYSVSIRSSQNKAKLDSAKASMEILLPSAKYLIQINCRKTFFLQYI